MKPLTQRNKWLVEGILPAKGQSHVVVADVVAAHTKEAAMEMVFDERIKENPGYIMQGAIPLLDMIRTLRKIYDEPVATTNHNFYHRTQC